MCPKILIVSEQMWPEGGGGLLATHLIIGLLRKFSALTVLTGTKNPSTYADVRYIYEPLLNVRTKPLLTMNLIKSEKRLNDFIKESDVVYIPRLAYPVIPFARKYGKRVIVHLHDYQPISYSSVIFHDSYAISEVGSIRNTIRLELLEHNSSSRAFLSSLFNPSTHLSRLWLSKADDVICVSNRQREIVGSSAPELAGKLKVIYNPLPKIHLIEKKLENPAFMYLGGDSYTKGLHIFLKASLELLTHNYNVRFMLTGNWNNVRNKAIIEKLNKNFNGAYRLLGRLRYEDALKLHSISQALLFPSVWEEPLPYAVLEAMLAGTIPIASRVGGVPEMVQGTYAEKMLFTPGDVTKIVDHMKSVLSLSKEQLVRIGMELRENTLKRFDGEQIKRQLLETFAA